MNPVATLSHISTRERTMLAALVLIGFLIWLSGLWRRWERVGVQHRKARNELAQQAVWLGDAARLEHELQDTLARLDPNSTFDAAELVALVDGMARTNGLKYDLGSVVTVEGKLFQQHTLKVGIKNAPLPRLIGFERNLRTNYPYAALQDFTITANKADPRLLNARLTVTSYQLKKEGR